MVIFLEVTLYFEESYISYILSHRKKVHKRPTCKLKIGVNRINFLELNLMPQKGVKFGA